MSEMERMGPPTKNLPFLSPLLSSRTPPYLSRVGNSIALTSKFLISTVGHIRSLACSVSFVAQPAMTSDILVILTLLFFVSLNIHCTVGICNSRITNWKATWHDDQCGVNAQHLAQKIRKMST